MLIIWREKKLPGQTCTYFQFIFCNSFVTSFILTHTYVSYQNPSNKNKDNVELRFYSILKYVKNSTLIRTSL